TLMSLAQVVAETGGEAAAAIAALELLSLKGCMVSADALHCHRRFTKTVRDGGGHYTHPDQGQPVQAVGPGDRRPGQGGPQPKDGDPRNRGDRPRPS
ncbi:MAG: hypothetical protein ABI306_05795, partial [Caulobacteraceae bacterium]